MTVDRPLRPGGSVHAGAQGACYRCRCPRQVRAAPTGIEAIRPMPGDARVASPADIADAGQKETRYVAKTVARMPARVDLRHVARMVRCRRAPQGPFRT